MGVLLRKLSRVPGAADFQFAAAVAAFGMLLRNSEHKGDATLDAVEEIARASRGKDQHGYRAEFLELIARTKTLWPGENRGGATWPL